METKGFLKYLIKAHLERDRGYTPKDAAYIYCLKIRDILLNSRANNRDQRRILRYLNHLIHQLPNKKQRMASKDVVSDMLYHD